MKYLYLDTEFNRKDFTKRGLVSIALATEEASYYAVNNDMDIQSIVSDPEIGEWMTEHVFEPHIPTHSLRRLRQDYPDVKDYATIGKEVMAFLAAVLPGGSADDDLTVIANRGSQDMVRLHTVLSNNDWGVYEEFVPTWFDDMARIKRKAYALGLTKEELPQQRPEEAHHALYDVEHEMRVHQYIRERYGDL